MQTLISLFFVLSGVLSFASPGVLENVAENRAAGLTQYSVRKDWDTFDVLLATQSCLFIDKDGKMYVEGKTYTVLVVDCQNPIEVENGVSLHDLGLIADQTNADLVHKNAIIILKGK